MTLPEHLRLTSVNHKRVILAQTKEGWRPVNLSNGALQSIGFHNMGLRLSSADLQVARMAAGKKPLSDRTIQRLDRISSLLKK